MPTARLPIDAAHRAATADAHPMGAVTGLQTALDAKATVAATDNGGIILAPVRQPTLAVEAVFPRGAQYYRVVWGDGQTAYAIDKAKRVRKTVDGGITWTLVSSYNTPVVELGYNAAFLKLASGALIAVSNQSPLHILRSADDGATWSDVYTMSANKTVLGPQSWCQDATTGYIYLGEYTLTATETVINVLRSTDDGATWSVFQTFDGPGSTGALKMKHIHGVQYDSVDARVWLSAGDGTYPGAGIYRMNDGGTAFEAVVQSDVVYPVALMFFPTYIAWGADSGDDQTIYRMARSEVGSASPEYTGIYRMNSTSWGTCRASSDGSAWLCLTSNEDPAGTDRLDSAAHVYHVSDNGARVVEVGCVPATADAYARIVPVGSAEVHTTTLWMAGIGFDGAVTDFQMRAAVCRGAAPLLADGRHVPPRVFAWQTFNAPQTALDASQTLAFAGLRAPMNATKLYVFDAGIYIHSGSGSARFGLYRSDTSSTFSTVSKASGAGGNGLRTGNERLDASDYVAVYTVPAGTSIEARLIEYGGAASVVASGYVTLGWGF